MHSIPTQRALIYLWVATKTRSPSDLAHIHRAASAYTRHASFQMSPKSITIHPSYTRFYAYPKNMNLLTPSDWAHFHRVASAHTRHVLHQISSKSIAIRPSYTRFRLKEHLYTFDPIYLWIGQTSDFAHIHMGSTGVHPPCQRTRSHRNPTPYVRATVVLLNEKVSVHTISNWKRRMMYASDRFTSENSL